MRDIKFRAWDGNRMYGADSDEEEFYVSAEGEPKCLEDVGWDSLQRPARRSDWIVMQHIGLKDKNGVEMYEGDVILNARKDWGVIVYKAPFYEVTVSETQSSSYTKEWIEACEVIGNIHENPELLK